MSIAVATTWEERLQDLGNIPAFLIQTIPAPGTATIEDVTYLRLESNWRSNRSKSSNTYSEMSRRRRDYFYAGVDLLWMVEHRTRTVTVFQSAQVTRNRKEFVA